VDDRQNMVNLAKICERYGGGGHARVGLSHSLLIRRSGASAAAEIVVELGRRRLLRPIARLQPPIIAKLFFRTKTDLNSY